MASKMSAPSKNTLLWLVAIGFFMETLDSTIVNTALPSMARALNESPLDMQSVVIAYALTLAVLIPLSGWLTDKFGTRKVYLASIVTFTLGSLLCALSQNLPQLVMARILQGAGGSMMLPVGRLAVLRAFPGAAYLSALSFVTMPALIGPLIGPTLGGWLVEYASWHWIFLINIPIGIIGCFATYKSMPQDDSITPRKFDLVGFFQIALFMVTVSVALDGLSESNMSHGLVFFLIIFGMAALVSYVLHTAKTPTPLFSLNLFKTRTYTIGILGNMFARVGSSGVPFLIPLFLQLCLGYSPFEAGLTMLPLAVAAILAKRLVTPVILKFGYRSFLITNTLLVGAGIASFALIDVNYPSWLRILQLFAFGIFNSMQFTAMNTLTMKDLDRQKSSDGNTMFSMVQMLSMSFSVAAAGSLLSAFLQRFEKLEAFHTTFVCMGSLTCISAWIFWQLSKEDTTTEKKLKTSDSPQPA
jgi:EmrB/QacA subfamily drug resistance transporter